ncbi:MarR family transcriptional regulator [Fodinicurvata sp. EGI_FJ10296]|uniref:MarR family winged helix-turn-helix transcriptional regulator n=1 Tax=Fodinicurvata sp. EGI_FJ10296 TaxID=3231908 RepID=UPI0034556727
MSDSPGIGFLLNDIARLMRLSFERKAGPGSLSRAQWSVLANLDRNDGISQAELACLLEVDPVTVTRLVDRLVAAELVVRSPDPDDRRVHRLSLTAHAQPHLARMAEIAGIVRSEALDGLEPEEVERFTRVADHIRSNLSRARTQHAGREKAAGR